MLNRKNSFILNYKTNIISKAKNTLILTDTQRKCSLTNVVRNCMKIFLIIILLLYLIF